MAAGSQNNSRWRALALIVAIGAVVGTLVFGSMNSMQAECSLCVEFRGQRECRTGMGNTPKDARAAAQRAACAVMASGMDESIACGNAAPTNVQCPT